MTELRAVLWDVDGTFAETERDGHRVAFNKAFEVFGLPWRWDEARYGELLSVTGGRERLMHDMHSRSDSPRLPGERDALARELHQSKNAFYAEMVAQGGIPLRDGVLPLMKECREQGVRMGVATTTSRGNLEALLQVHLGNQWREWFDVLVCGEDVERKNPPPRSTCRLCAAFHCSLSKPWPSRIRPAGWRRPGQRTVRCWSRAATTSITDCP